MASLLEHVTLNKLTDELSDAITDVGGVISNEDGPMDYPNIIRNQLTAGSGIKGKIYEGDGITIEQVEDGFKISANTNAVTTHALSPTFPKDTDIPAGTPIQEVFEQLFDVVLPSLKSVGDGSKLITAAPDGTYEYYNDFYGNDGDGILTGLEPNGKYIILYVYHRKTPVCIGPIPVGGSDIDLSNYITKNDFEVLKSELNSNYVTKEEVVNLVENETFETYKTSQSIIDSDQNYKIQIIEDRLNSEDDSVEIFDSIFNK